MLVALVDLSSRIYEPKQIGLERLNQNGGGRGIRTHETFLPTGFQDQLHRPLGQTSVEEFSGY